MGTHPIFESDFDCLTDRISKIMMIRTVVRRSSLLLGSVGKQLTPRTHLVQAKRFDCAQNAAREKQLENLLREADQTSSKEMRCNLMNQVVEIGEAMELPLGHQGKLYEMAANSHLEVEHFESAEKYFLIAI